MMSIVHFVRVRVCIIAGSRIGRSGTNEKWKGFRREMLGICQRGDMTLSEKIYTVVKLPSAR